MFSFFTPVAQVDHLVNVSEDPFSLGDQENVRCHAKREREGRYASRRPAVYTCRDCKGTANRTHGLVRQHARRNQIPEFDLRLSCIGLDLNSGRATVREAGPVGVWCTPGALHKPLT